MVSGSSSGRARARRRISLIITDAIVSAGLVDSSNDRRTEQLTGREAGREGWVATAGCHGQEGHVSDDVEPSRGDLLHVEVNYDGVANIVVVGEFDRSSRGRSLSTPAV